MLLWSLGCSKVKYCRAFPRVHVSAAQTVVNTIYPVSALVLCLLLEKRVSARTYRQACNDFLLNFRAHGSSGQTTNVPEGLSRVQDVAMVVRGFEAIAATSYSIAKAITAGPTAMKQPGASHLMVVGSNTGVQTAPHRSGKLPKDKTSRWNTPL